MIGLLKFVIPAVFLGGLVMKWQMQGKREAELRRARETENASPVHKLIDRVKIARGQMRERMYERMREHMQA